jgi:hypothetical protein
MTETFPADLVLSPFKSKLYRQSPTYQLHCNVKLQEIKKPVSYKKSQLRDKQLKIKSRWC